MPDDPKRRRPSDEESEAVAREVEAEQEKLVGEGPTPRTTSERAKEDPGPAQRPIVPDQEAS